MSYCPSCGTPSVKMDPDKFICDNVECRVEPFRGTYNFIE